MFVVFVDVDATMDTNKVVIVTMAVVFAVPVAAMGAAVTLIETILPCLIVANTMVVAMAVAAVVALQDYRCRDSAVGAALSFLKSFLSEK